MASFFTLMLGLAAILLAYALYDLGEESYVRETDAAIESEMALILSQIESLSQQDRVAFLQQRAANSANPIFYYDDQGTLLVASLPSLPKAVSSIAEGLVGFSLPIEGQSRQFAAKIHTFESELSHEPSHESSQVSVRLPSYRLLIARDIDEIASSHDRLRWLSLFILLFMLIVVLVSFLISTFVVSRINIIANTAQSIMETGDLSHRISIESRWDDLSHLAHVLNLLLERMESLMLGVKNAGHSIAHDLRTPLTQLRAHLEQVKHKAESEPIAVEVLDQLTVEADQILSLFSRLLRIANLENKKQQIFAPVKLYEVISDVLELYEPVAEDKQLSLHWPLRGSGVDQLQQRLVLGDRDLLFQVFANLLDNAIKFTPEGGEIFLAMETLEQRESEKNRQDDREAVRILIADTGGGVSEQELDKLCERFYRSDKSRNSAGSGLGLSLVKAAVELHGGQLNFYSNGHSSSLYSQSALFREKLTADFGLVVEVLIF